MNNTSLAPCPRPQCPYGHLLPFSGIKHEGVYSTEKWWVIPIIAYKCSKCGHTIRLEKK